MIENVYDFLKLFFRIEETGYTYEALDNAIECAGFKNIELRTKQLQTKTQFIKEDIYCPNCGENRKYQVRLAHSEIRNPARDELIIECIKDYSGKDDFEEFTKYLYDRLVSSSDGILIIGDCLQCENKVSIMIYNDNGKTNMIKLFRTGCGASTSNTPNNIKYYLNEAYKCRTMGAYTGAVAMYRTALENLLYDKGYTKNNLSQKIRDFENDKKNNQLGRWADCIDGQILDKIRDLGNWAVHPNKGDISRQQHFKDEELILCLDDIFKYMLEDIYERDIKKNEILGKLKQKNNDLRYK